MGKERNDEIIRKDSGEHFDSRLAECFLNCRPELEAYYNGEAEG